MEGRVGREHLIDEGIEVAQEWGMSVGKERLPVQGQAWCHAYRALRARLGAPGSHHVFSPATLVNW